MFQKFIVGAVIVAALTVSAPQADAFWGHGCCRPVYSNYYVPSYVTSCYTACYSPCATSCCDTSCGWYLGVRRGPIRRAAFGPCRWYRDCCYDACCTTTSCYTDSGCTEAGCTDCGSGVEQSTPTEAQPMPAPTKVKNGATDSTAIPTRANSGLLTVWVPANAKVFINDHETKTAGTRRRYVSYGLQSGLTYKYVVRAQIVRDGKLVEEVQTVYMKAGASEGLAFGFNPTTTQSLAAAH